jgi:hypothetical protein
MGEGTVRSRIRGIGGVERSIRIHRVRLQGRFQLHPYAAEPLEMRVLKVVGLAIALLLVSCGHMSGSSNDALGDVGQAQDAAAQVELQQALVAAKTMFAESGSYTAADSSPQGLVTQDPSMCFVGPNTPSVAAGATCEAGHGSASISIDATASSWSGAMMSGSGKCLWMKDTPMGTKYGTGSPCTGLAAQAASTPNP